MIMVKASEKSGPPPSSLMQGIAALGQEAGQKGVLVEMGGLMPSAAGALVRVSGGKMSVTDGPFSEAKEVIGGYAVYDVATKKDAIYWTERFMKLHLDHWPGWEGESEVRQVF